MPKYKNESIHWRIQDRIRWRYFHQRSHLFKAAAVVGAFSKYFHRAKISLKPCMWKLLKHMLWDLTSIEKPFNNTIVQFIPSLDNQISRRELQVTMFSILLHTVDQLKMENLPSTVENPSKDSSLMYWVTNWQHTSS